MILFAKVTRIVTKSAFPIKYVHLVRLGTIATLWLLLSLLEWAQEAGLVLETYVLLV